jgi:hypothetical protein
MEDNQIVELVVDKLHNEDLWFTQKTDPTWEEPSSYYKLNEYGEPTATTIKKIAKEVNDLVGDGAVDIEDAIDIWVINACSEYKVAFTESLVTKFSDKPVIDGIEAYESPIQPPYSKKQEVKTRKTEGAGAGYSISGSIDNANVNSFEITEVKRDT